MSGIASGVASAAFWNASYMLAQLVAVFGDGAEPPPESAFRVGSAERKAGEEPTTKKPAGGAQAMLRRLVPRNIHAPRSAAGDKKCHIGMIGPRRSTPHHGILARDVEMSSRARVRESPQVRSQLLTRQ